MKKSDKAIRKPTAKIKRNTKRDLFAELVEGMKALADARQVKGKLQTH